MKYIWEASDFESENNWGMLAERGEEIVIIGGTTVTSLRDGHHWEYKDRETMAASFNDSGYVPIFAPVNASVILKDLIKKRFNYGKQ